MSRDWVLTLMGLGAGLELLGVLTIGLELRRTRLAVERASQEMQGNLATARANPSAALGVIAVPLTRLVAEIAVGGRGLRVGGFLSLLLGIALTLVANAGALALR